MATPWTEFIGAVITLLQQIGKIGNQNKQQADAALIAILSASDQTHGYIKATQNGVPRNIEREHALSNLWNICSVHLEPLDAGIAARCRLKGDYWRNPDEWTLGDIDKTRIGLDRIKKEAEYLLKLRIHPPKAK